MVYLLIAPIIPVVVVVFGLAVLSGAVALIAVAGAVALVLTLLIFNPPGRINQTQKFYFRRTNVFQRLIPPGGHVHDGSAFDELSLTPYTEPSLPGDKVVHL